MSNLVSTDWLGDHLYMDELAVFDASWHLPAVKRNARAEFTAERIPGARFFDIDDISDKSTPLPHMLPSADVFTQKIQQLGISSSSHVIAYDSTGLFSAARCWWMFKVFGHDKVAVLDGGLKKWRAEERITDSGPTSPPKQGNFKAHLRPHMVASMADVASGQMQIIDARSPTRFRGEEPEPRPGVKPGHIPGAHNLHYASLLNEDGTLKGKKDLEAAFLASGINKSKQIVTSCGSGVTAAILTLSLHELGIIEGKLYDGSWAEWGASDRAIVTGD